MSRSAATAAMVIITVVALFIGGFVGWLLREPAEPAHARTVTVQNTVPGPTTTRFKTVPGPETTIEHTVFRDKTLPDTGGRITLRRHKAH